MGWVRCADIVSGYQKRYFGTLVPDVYINNNNGQEVSYNTWSATGYLEVSGTDTVIADVSATDNGSTVYNAFYDAGKTFISSFSYLDRPVTIPQNAKYMRVSAPTAWFSATSYYYSLVNGVIALEFKNYVKFNGTGIILPWTQSSDWKLECVFHEVEYHHDTCITGNSGGYTQGQYLAAYNNRYDVGTGNGFSNFGSWTSGEHIYINNDENDQSTLDDTASVNYTPTTNDKFYTIGCRENGIMGYQGYIKSFKIYSKSNGTLLHDLRPCSILNLGALLDVKENTLYSALDLQGVNYIT